MHVKKHVQDLKKLAIEALEPEKRNMISRRITGLLSRCVYIRLDDSLLEKKNIYADRIETGVRAYKDIARYGLIDLEKIHASTPFIKEMIDYMILCGFRRVGFIALCEAVKRTISISRTLGNCSTMVLCKN